jgi:hypothetical protein
VEDLSFKTTFVESTWSGTNGEDQVWFQLLAFSAWSSLVLWQKSFSQSKSKAVTALHPKEV